MSELKWYEDQDWSVSGIQAFQLIERHAEDWDEIGAAMDAWLARRTRPPVAGLAELTDEQIVAMFIHIDSEKTRAAIAYFCSHDQTSQGWEAKRKEIIAKAAREFLGKVE